MGEKYSPTRANTGIDTFTLSVIVPVYNEERTLRQALDELTSVEIPCRLELICIDDGSTDRSLEILLAEKDPRIIVLGSESNAGKGAALRKGFARATGDYILIHDADLEYDPNDWKALIEPVLRGDSRVVFGSRFLGQRTGMKFHSYLANRFLTMLTKVMFGSGITDVETCSKLIETDLLRSLPLDADRFNFEPQIAALLLRRGERILEVPISYRGRDKSAGKKIGFRDGIEAVAMLWTCWRK